MKKIDWKSVSRISALFNLAFQSMWLGYAMGAHRSGAFYALNIFNVTLAVYFVYRSQKTFPMLTIVNQNHPILLSKPVVIIDAEFEEI